VEELFPMNYDMESTPTVVWRCLGKSLLPEFVFSNGIPQINDVEGILFALQKNEANYYWCVVLFTLHAACSIDAFVNWLF
jgi:hypothetical protein